MQTDLISYTKSLSAALSQLATSTTAVTPTGAVITQLQTRLVSIDAQLELAQKRHDTHLLATLYARLRAQILEPARNIAIQSDPQAQHAIAQSLNALWEGGIALITPLPILDFSALRQTPQDAVLNVFVTTDKRLSLVRPIIIFEIHVHGAESRENLKERIKARLNNGFTRLMDSFDHELDQLMREQILEEKKGTLQLTKDGSRLVSKTRTKLRTFYKTERGKEKIIVVRDSSSQTLDNKKDVFKEVHASSAGNDWITFFQLFGLFDAFYRPTTTLKASHTKLYDILEITPRHGVYEETLEPLRERALFSGLSGTTTLTLTPFGEAVALEGVKWILGFLNISETEGLPTYRTVEARQPYAHPPAPFLVTRHGELHFRDMLILHAINALGAPDLKEIENFLMRRLPKALDYQAIHSRVSLLSSTIGTPYLAKDNSILPKFRADVTQTLQAVRRFLKVDDSIESADVSADKSPIDPKAADFLVAENNSYSLFCLLLLRLYAPQSETKMAHVAYETLGISVFNTNWLNSLRDLKKHGWVQGEDPNCLLTIEGAFIARECHRALLRVFTIN